MVYVGHITTIATGATRRKEHPVKYVAHMTIHVKNVINRK